MNSTSACISILCIVSYGTVVNWWMLHIADTTIPHKTIQHAYFVCSVEMLVAVSSNNKMKILYMTEFDKIKLPYIDFWHHNIR